jgi:hypothetical protein
MGFKIGNFPLNVLEGKLGRRMRDVHQARSHQALSKRARDSDRGGGRIGKRGTRSVLLDFLFILVLLFLLFFAGIGNNDDLDGGSEGSDLAPGSTLWSRRGSSLYTGRGSRSHEKSGRGRAGGDLNSERAGAGWRERGQIRQLLRSHPQPRQTIKE